MRLHARKSVGNGLLLRFLESQRIVQRAGEKVRQSAQQQHFLLGKIARLARIPRTARRATVRHRPRAAPMEETEVGRTSLGVEALASRTMATCPVRATCPIILSESPMRRPSGVLALSPLRPES